MEYKKDRYGTKMYKRVCVDCKTILWRRKRYFRDVQLCKECYRVRQVSKAKIVSNCATCGKTVVRRKSDLRQTVYGRMFCDKSCAAVYNNKHMPKRKPENDDAYHTYRKRALEHYGERCMSEDCELKNVKYSARMLDIHHKDRNRDNNTLENLIVLCVWCHAKLTRRSPM